MLSLVACALKTAVVDTSATSLPIQHCVTSRKSANFTHGCDYIRPRVYSCKGWKLNVSHTFVPAHTHSQKHKCATPNILNAAVQSD